MDGGMNNTLCVSNDPGGYEKCTVTTELSTFYTEVLAYTSHGIGKLIFTGLNLNYVTNANRTEESPPLANYNCNQTTTLFGIVDDITNSIDETHGNWCFFEVICLKVLFRLESHCFLFKLQFDSNQ